MSIFTSLKIHWLLYILMQNEGVLGFVDITCNPTNTAFGQESVCTCTTDSGTGIAWQKGPTTLMQCFNGGNCDNPHADYANGHSTSGTNQVFTITIKSFGYSDCSDFTCKDQDTTDTDQETLTLYEFTSGSPSIYSEPGAGKNGTIEITTDCLFKESDIVVNWYTVDGGSYEKFTPDGSFQTATTCSDASKVCSSVHAVTLNIGFTHTEKSSKCGQIRVEVYNSVNSSIKLEWTTSDRYCIDEGTTPPPTTSSTTSPPTSSTTTKSPDIPVVIIVPCVVVVILIICIIVCILLRKRSNRKKKHRADSENVQMPQVDINEVDITVT